MKIIFPSPKKIVIKIISLLCSSSVMSFYYVAFTFDVVSLFVRIMLIPTFLFWLYTHIDVVMGMFEYLVLTQDEIKVYYWFIPIGKLKIGATLLMNHIYYRPFYNKKGYLRWITLSENDVPLNGTVDLNMSVGTPFEKVRNKKREISSLRMNYDKNYEQAIRAFYNVTVNIQEDDGR